MMFRKAERRKAWLKMAVTGPSGSGKTFSALQLARGLAGPNGSIALIDTENESASLYSDRVDFDTCPISAPFTTEKYIQAINGAAEAGYSVLIIDSLTHAWAGEGGLLAQKEALDARGGNSFTNWAGITKKQEAFKAALLQAPIHVIATMRSKTEYAVEQSGGGGKATPRKVGTAPIQRDGMEYEFTTVLDIGMGHEAFASKDRTGLFDGVVGMLTVKHGQALRHWLESGAEPLPEEAEPSPSQPQTARPAQSAQQAQPSRSNTQPPTRPVTTPAAAGSQNRPQPQPQPKAVHSGGGSTVPASRPQQPTQQPNQRPNSVARDFSCVVCGKPVTPGRRTYCDHNKLPVCHPGNCEGRAKDDAEAMRGLPDSLPYNQNSDRERQEQREFNATYDEYEAGGATGPDGADADADADAVVSADDDDISMLGDPFADEG